MELKQQLIDQYIDGEIHSDDLIEMVVELTEKINKLENSETANVESIEEKSFESEKQKDCPHTEKFYYNHGYHRICKDCGEEV